MSSWWKRCPESYQGNTKQYKATQGKGKGKEGKSVGKVERMSSRLSSIKTKEYKGIQKYK